MNNDNAPDLAAFGEDLSELPLHREIRDKLREMAARGVPAAELVDAGLAVGAALSIQAEGIRRTAARLFLAADQLAVLVPDEQRRAN